MKRAPLAAGVLLALASLATLADDVTVNLGSRARVAGLFSFPENCSVSKSCDWTLDETVAHYLNQDLQRDGFTEATVNVEDTVRSVTASFKGVPADYGDRLKHFLDAGALAKKGADKMHVDKKWQNGWYFFLPLGMALQNRHSVELLHFPPDYSLTEAHDYLESKTTDRWAHLLVLNGVADKDTPAYQTIIDIAPIAAPASDGSKLEGVYSYFNKYQTTLLTEWTDFIGGPVPSYPMVAFGGPVREWVKTQYNVDLDVLTLGQIPVTSQRNVPVLGSNHPSYIWYAADPKNHGGNQAAADKQGIEVMGEDLTASCWQASMGLKPTTAPDAALASCKTTWPAGSPQVCQQFYITIRNLTPDQAKAKCAG